MPDASVWVPLAAGFVGALIGSAGSVLVVLIQSKSDERRERRRLALDMALAQYNLHIDRVKLTKETTIIPTLEIFILYNHELIDLIDRGSVDADSLRSLQRRMDGIAKDIDAHRPKYRPGAPPT